MIVMSHDIMESLIGNIALIESQTTKQNLDYKKILNSYEKNFFIKILKNMVLSRLWDEEINQLIKEGVPINQHSAVGQEASQAVAASLLQKDDYIINNHRGWGWAIGKGLDLKKMMAELMYKKDGYCKGKGGPHLASREHNLYLRVGIQGSYISIAAGIGLGLKMQGRNNVCLCQFGDGSSNQGYVHEGMNIAAANKLPVIYLIENNGYALFTPYQETTSVENIANRAVGYGIPGYIVDGMDAFSMIEVASIAIDRARRGDGPTLIESKTYRYHGHTAYDRFCEGGYRPKEEIKKWESRDPIDYFSEKLIESNLLTKIEFEEIKQNFKKDIQEAVDYGKQSDYPKPEEYFKDVYGNFDEKEIDY